MVLENRLQLLKMQLVVNSAVVARLQTTQESLLVKRIHHLDVALVGFRPRSSKELLHRLSEIVVRQLVQIIGSVTSGFRRIVVARRIIRIRIVIGRATEHRVIRIWGIRSHERLKAIKVVRVAFVLLNHVARNGLAFRI